MGYDNPLFQLPAAKKLLELPLAQRMEIAALFSELRVQANEQAENAWARRKSPMAAYWRATSTYCRHYSHLLRQKDPRVLRAARTEAGADDIGAGDSLGQLLQQDAP